MTKITRGKFLKAVNKSGGILQVIADRLSVSRRAVYDYLEKHDFARKSFDESREQLTDMAEAQLVNKIQAGDNWAIGFRLKTIGKDRGYVEKTEVSLKGELAVGVLSSVESDELLELLEEEKNE